MTTTTRPIIHDYPVRTETPEQTMARRIADTMRRETWCRGRAREGDKFCAMGTGEYQLGYTSEWITRLMVTFRNQHNGRGITTINDQDGFDAVRAALYAFADAELGA